MATAADVEKKPGLVVIKVANKVANKVAKRVAKRKQMEYNSK